MLHEISTGGDLIQLVYVSAATVPFTDEQLDQLLAVARENNSKIDVTGVLLYRDGTFFQALEGPEPVVTKLFEKISLDKRHGNLLMLAKAELPDRNFADWSMGFVRDEQVIEQLPGFVDFFRGRTFIDLRGDARRMRQILDGFRRGRWRRSCDQSVATN